MKGFGDMLDTKVYEDCFKIVETLTIEELVVTYTKDQLWSIYSTLCNVGEPKRNSCNKEYVANLCKDAYYSIRRAKVLLVY